MFTDTEDLDSSAAAAALLLAAWSAYPPAFSIRFVSAICLFNFSMLTLSSLHRNSNSFADSTSEDDEGAEEILVSAVGAVTTPPPLRDLFEAASLSPFRRISNPAITEVRIFT